MPSLICNKCNYKTNTATSNHLFPLREDGKANECYARLNEKNEWIEGCSLKTADELTKKIITNFLVKDNK